jgi:hypothetical protein
VYLVEQGALGQPADAGARNTGNVVGQDGDDGDVVVVALVVRHEEDGLCARLVAYTRAVEPLNITPFSFIQSISIGSGNITAT